MTDVASALRRLERDVFACRIPRALRALWIELTTVRPEPIWCDDARFTPIERADPRSWDADDERHWLIAQAVVERGLRRDDGGPPLCIFGTAGDGGHAAYHALDLTRPRRAWGGLGPVDYPVVLLDEGEPHLRDLVPSSSAWIRFVDERVDRDEPYDPWELAESVAPRS